MSLEEASSRGETTVTPPISPVKSFGNPRFGSAEKTSALLLGSPTSKKRFNDNCKKYIRTYSPVKSIGSPNPYNDDSPDSIITTSGKKLNFAQKLGDISIYSDTVVRKKEFSGNQLKEILELLFELSSEIKLDELVECKENSIKHQEAIFTSKTRSKTNKRKPTQGAAMAGEDSCYTSAKILTHHFFTEEKITEVSETLKFSPEDSLALKKQFCTFAVEWLHLLDFANAGNEGQTDKNLVFGLAEANSQMMITEELERRLLEKGEKIKVSVDAEIVKFHVAHEIKICISVNDHTTTITFNPFSRTKPIVESVSYLEVAEKVKKIRYDEKVSQEKIEEKIPNQTSLKNNLFGFFRDNSAFEPLQTNSGSPPNQFQVFL